MRSLKTMLIAGAAAGMMLGGATAASAQGQPIPEGNIRDCVREMVWNMRNCNGGEVDGVKPVDGVTKRSEQAQGFNEQDFSCSLEALFTYFDCADGQGEFKTNNPVRVPLKPTNAKAATPSNK